MKAPRTGPERESAISLVLQHQAADTPVHRLDPRIRLLGWLAVNIILATANDPIFLFALWLGVVLVGRAGGIPVTETLKSLLPVLPFILFVILANVGFYRPAQHVSDPTFLGWIIGPEHRWLPEVPLYTETLVFTVGTMIRLTIIVTSTITLIKLVSPSEMGLAFVKMRLPPEIGMAVSMTFAYVPVVLGQLQSVMEAQQSRAWTVKTNNPIRRFRAYLPLSIPTFFRSYVASEAMAAAMMSRGFGYDIDRRTELHPLQLRNRDYVIGMLLFVFMVGGFLLGYTGLTKYTTTMEILGLR